MRVRTMLVGVALLAVLALAAAPAASAAAKQRTGERISLFGGFQVFPAGQPFHVQHGWGIDQGRTEAVPQANGSFGFTLAVDGVERREDFVDKFHEDHPDFGLLQWRQWVHNFPDGMTGTHTFTGHWFGACTGVVASGLAAGPCEHPTELTTAIAPLTITVVFMP